VLQIIDVADDGHCQTANYAYWLSDDAGVWLLRWEYFRKPPRSDYRYPLAHLHVNGTWSHGDLPKLHIVTARVTIEHVLWHLIAEWCVSPKHDHWRETLGESIGGFEDRRTAP
jgi:hypothetical protein